MDRASQSSPDPIPTATPTLMAARVASFDWSPTPLGAIQTWPPSLRTAVDICTGSRFPMFVWWGQELVNIYNDAYVPVLGMRHPDALGRSAPDIWGEIWTTLGPQVDAVMSRGESTWNERVRLDIERHGHTEETYFTWAYSPIRDESGRVAGLFCVCNEETRRVLAERERDRLAEEQRRTDERARTILESITDAFFALDTGWRFTYINPQGERLLGREPGDLIGKVLWEVYPGTEGSEFERVYRRVAAERVSASTTVYYPDHDRWYEIHVYPAPGGGISVYFRDASEQNRADTALRNSEQRLAGVVEMSLDCIVGMDHEGRVTEWNPAAEATFGYTRAEAMGQEMASLIIPPALRGFHREGLAHYLATGDGAVLRKRLELTALRKDGTEFPVELTINPLNLAGPPAFTGHLRDITERKRIESTTRESEQRFRQIADAMPQIVWAARPDGVLDYYNRRWFEFIDVPESEAGEATAWGQYVHPDDIGRVAEAWGASLRTSDPYHVEFRVRGAGGGYRWFLVRAEPVRDASGAVLRWYGTCTDIENRKRDEKRDRFLVDLDDAVRPLEDPREITATHARLLGEHLAADRCAYADVEADQDTFNLTGDYNRGVPSIVGRYRFTDFGQQALELMRANEPYVVEDVDTHQPPVGELAAYRATMIQAVVCVPLHKAGRFVAAMAVHQRVPRRWSPEEVVLVQRVTARCWESIERARVTRDREKLLESERAARAEAERAGRMKDEFLATLSHELRTPLNAILGWSQIVQKSKPGSEDIAHGIGVIERNARAQSQIIEDLLDMSRIISGKVRLDVQRLDLSTIMRGAVETARPTADAKAVRLQSVIDPLHGVVVSGDANRLQQVLWNLLSNAIKFTPRGGRVQALLERVNSHIEISVIDTGEGIDAAFLPHVFDRFRQADASTTRRHGGVGLGLSIVKELVELHGGSVRAKSNGAGKGSTFVVTLPLTAVHDEPKPATPRRHPRSAPSLGRVPDPCVEVEGVRVLVVDDEPDARDLVRRLLEDVAAVVTTAASAEEAMTLLKEGRFDVLVSDVGMPGEDGYALIKRVRALGKSGGGNIPAIALTAYARAEDRVKTIAAGFQMHVAKPVEPAELITMVAGAAGKTGRP